jgi:hypothetical protein
MSIMPPPDYLPAPYVRPSHRDRVRAAGPGPDARFAEVAPVARRSSGLARRIAVRAAALAIGAGALLAGTATAADASPGWSAEDGSRVSAGYYAPDATDYAARLDRPGACRIASAIFAAWRPGQPLPPAKISNTMITCMNTP